MDKRRFKSEEISRLDNNLENLNNKLNKTVQKLNTLKSLPHSLKDVTNELKVLNNIWEELFPAEQSRILKLIIKKIVVYQDEVTLHFQSDGLLPVITELHQDPNL